MNMRYRIRELREAKGLSQAALGALLGVHWQTVQRAESGKTTLSERKIEEYARALDTEPQHLMRAEEGRMVTVKGYVQAGAWAETWEWHDADQYDVPVPDDPALRSFKLYAAEARGPSMNRRYPEGTVLVFTDAVETHDDLQIGRRYIIERERADGLREATVKKLWRDDVGSYWLLPESDDPRFQEPLPLQGGEDDTIRIIGRVRFAVSRE